MSGSGGGNPDDDEFLASGFSPRGARSPPGLTPMIAMRSRLRNREVSTRKQVGEAETMLSTGPGESFEGRS